MVIFSLNSEIGSHLLQNDELLSIEQNLGQTELQTQDSFLRYAILGRVGKQAAERGSVSTEKGHSEAKRRE